MRLFFFEMKQVHFCQGKFFYLSFTSVYEHYQNWYNQIHTFVELYI